MSLLALSVELRAVIEAAEHEIDKDWVESLRKGWKALVQDADAFPGRVTKDGNTMDQPTLVEAVNAALRYLMRVDDYLERLRSELLINKGLWSLDKILVTLKTTAAEIADKVMKELDVAKKTVRDCMWYARTLGENPVTYGLFKSQSNFDLGIRGIGTRVASDMAEIDKGISGKLLRYLTSILTQLGSGNMGDSFGDEVVPDVVDIGKLRVTFLDTPLKGKYHDKAKEKAGEVRDPHGREAFLKALYKAQALLRKRGLDFLWYGTLLVLPSKKIDVKAFKQGNQDYAKLSSIAATYTRNDDIVRVYADDLRASTVIHELGHRYYYKFLTRQGREHFKQWFGKVKATSSYGETNASEDFAEVFAAYVKGKDLDRDQLERFKSVLDLKAKRTERRGLLRSLRALVDNAPNVATS